jgi:hypothetical protein
MAGSYSVKYKISTNKGMQGVYSLNFTGQSGTESEAVAKIKHAKNLKNDEHVIIVELKKL